MGQAVSITINDTINALTQKTLKSQHLQRTYTIKKARVHFALGQERLVRIRIIASIDDSIPTDQVPYGTNVLVQYTEKEYLVGNDTIIELELDYRVDTRSSWIKLHAVNNDYYRHSIIAEIILDMDIPGE